MGPPGSAKKIEDMYPIKFLPDQAFNMPAAKLHMLLVLLVGQGKNFSYFGSAASRPGTLLKWQSFFRPGASVMAS